MEYPSSIFREWRYCMWLAKLYTSMSWADLEGMLWGRGSPEIGLGTNPPNSLCKQNKIFPQTTEKFLNPHTNVYEWCKTVCDDFFFRGGGPTMWVSFTLVISRCHSKFLIFISPAGEDGGPELQPVHNVWGM